MNEFRITIRNKQTGDTFNQEVKVLTFAEAASKAYVAKARCQQGTLPNGAAHGCGSEWAITSIKQLWRESSDEE